VISLPIDPRLPDIAAALCRGNLVLEAPPGAGKTTRVPPALLDRVDGEIVIAQPRRLAARLAARRVAEERGEKLGQTVGYEVRFERAVGPETRLRFVTEGVLLQRMLRDPLLDGVSVVLLDEFHERHVEGDFALALLRRLQRGTRPDLRVGVMSATLDAAPVAAYLGECPRIRAEGKPFDLSVEYLEQPDRRPLSAQVASAMHRLLRSGLDGDVLVFLPGAAEIRRARESCDELARERDLLILPLYGDLPPAEQDRAVRPAERRKLILSTNVAETSVTIDGVAAVIDSGLANRASHSPWTGLPLLQTGRVSRASAAQRAGRAGRTRAGRCLRLYTRHDHDTRPEQDLPEILRQDLARTTLHLHAIGVGESGALEWLDAPPEAALGAARALVDALGAVAADGGLTAIGERLLRLPVHPRLGRVVAEGERRGVAAEAAVIAALASERNLRVRGDARARSNQTTGSSDLLDLLELFESARRAGFAAHALRGMGVNPGAARAVDRARKQLSRLCKGRGASSARVTGEEERETALRIALLSGFPDRVARRRGPTSSELLLCTGGSVILSEASCVREAELMVVVDAEERKSGGRAGRTMARLASAIEVDWLLDLFPEALDDATELVWDGEAKRVVRVSRLAYRQLVLEESRRSPGVGEEEEAARMLAEAAQKEPGELRCFRDADAVARWRDRAAFVAGVMPEAEVLSGPGISAAILDACRGRASFAELRQVVLLDYVKASIGHEAQRLIDQAAPDRVRLRSGRRVKVTYETDQSPWIASRLQDFFGMTETPTVAAGRVPLVLHLLAPNQRAVQVTTDLAGFWQRHYPTLRKQLERRYPKHAWPDDPTVPQPGMRRRRRR